jgi:hypothetical protein
MRSDTLNDAPGTREGLYCVIVLAFELELGWMK